MTDPPQYDERGESASNRIHVLVRPPADGSSTDLGREVCAAEGTLHYGRQGVKIDSMWATETDQRFRDFVTIALQPPLLAAVEKSSRLVLYFAGKSGSGKTYAMGRVVPLVVNDMFETMAKKCDRTFAVFMQLAVVPVGEEKEEKTPWEVVDSKEKAQVVFQELSNKRVTLVAQPLADNSKRYPEHNSSRDMAKITILLEHYPTEKVDGDETVVLRAEIVLIDTCGSESTKTCMSDKKTTAINTW